MGVGVIGYRKWQLKLEIIGGSRWLEAQLIQKQRSWLSSKVVWDLPEWFFFFLNFRDYKLTLKVKSCINSCIILHFTICYFLQMNAQKQKGQAINAASAQKAIDILKVR